MAWTTFQLFVSLLMVITGSVNTITTKWANRTKSVGRDGVEKYFHHPFFQALYLALGCMACLAAYKILFYVVSRRGEGAVDEHQITKGNRDYNTFILAIPSSLGLTATSIMYIGLNLTYASSFQMLRGSVIVFVGILSIVFLKRTLGLQKWIGITFVILGLVTVGYADYVSQGADDSHGTDEIIIGDILIIFAQIIAAAAFIVEEKFVRGLDIPPLEAVGWGGTFGFFILGFLLIPMYFIKADRPLTQHKGDRVEDIIDAFVQMGNNWQLCVAVSCNIISVAFFNFAGTSVTKELSATTRVVLDSIRTINIWGFSLAFFGQSFHWLQLLGFCFLILGMCVYNDIIGASTFSIWRRTEEESSTNAEAAGSK